MNKTNELETVELETVELLMEKNVIVHNDFYINDKSKQFYYMNPMMDSLFDNNNISQIQINENDSLLAFSDIFDKHIKNIELLEEYRIT